MMRVINHEAIMASAGSGKTFQLAHRYIMLLANGVHPDRIIALTFSRKAAGEIFDSVITYLLEAADSQEQAVKTADRIGKPQFSRADFLMMLRGLLDSMHRLHIGTLDRFAIGIARAFPLELGIPCDFQLMENEGAPAVAVRQHVLGRILNGEAIDEGTRRQLWDAYRQATFGQEEKGPERSLDDFVARYHGRYRVLPMMGAWGNVDAIWQEGWPWGEDVDSIDEIADDLEALLSDDGLPPAVMDRWRTFLGAVRTFDASSVWDRDVEYLFEKLSQNIEGLREGTGGVRIGKRDCPLSFEEGKLALLLVAHLMKTEVGVALEKTQGLFRVLDRYELAYDEAVRCRGKLTFDDVQYLLTGTNQYSGGALLSRSPGEDARLYIDYRLDCKLDHWLLDEFQDTSDLQWEVLSNLADEILQDNSGQRSYFFVGDVKQAIYGWRGGNTQLFGKILQRYQECIEQRPMDVSFRSAWPIIDTVNRVFGALPKGVLPSMAIERWEGVWHEHQCREGVVPENGYAALIEPDSFNGTVKPAQEDRHRIVAAVLRDIDPFNRGLSVGVLVRTNENGKRLVSYLRRECEGMSIIHEGRGGIVDNPVVALMLSLVRFAAHPGDTFAWRHIEMSPLATYLRQERLGRDDLPLMLLHHMQAKGFYSLLRKWSAALDRVHPLDGFGRKRMNDLAEAAIVFDAEGDRDADAFLRFIDAYAIHELATENAVRVMTVHQSKGLGFDVVILPDLQGEDMRRSGALDFTIARDVSGRPVWALKMPRRIIALTDPVLNERVCTEDQAACFDELCVQYVSLTRAKRALYMITSFPGKTSEVINPAALLRFQLNGETKPTDGPRLKVGGEDVVCLYETGDRDWHRKVAHCEREQRAVPEWGLPHDYAKRTSLHRRLARVAPSDNEKREYGAGMLFERSYREGREFGKAIHELFSGISWIEETDLDAVVRKWRKRSPADEGFNRRVTEAFSRGVGFDAVRRELSRPGGNVELWREKRFEIVLDDKWVTGVFDRVIIMRDAQDLVHAATILDFKSDEISGDDDVPAQVARRYQSQLGLYGKALSRILGLPPNRISLRLLFTGAGKVCDLTSDS